MTGFGEAHLQQDGLGIMAEVRTINGRYFKLSVRTPDGYGSLEPKIEPLVRQHVRRATVQLNVRVNRARSAEDYRIEETVLESYRRQLDSLSACRKRCSARWPRFLAAASEQSRT